VMQSPGSGHCETSNGCDGVCVTLEICHHMVVLNILMIPLSDRDKLLSIRCPGQAQNAILVAEGGEQLA
jgi:hypothetical protein